MFFLMTVNPTRGKYYVHKHTKGPIYVACEIFLRNLARWSYPPSHKDRRIGNIDWNVGTNREHQQGRKIWPGYSNP